jgi:hypothetical protein
LAVGGWQLAVGGWQLVVKGWVADDRLLSSVAHRLLILPYHLRSWRCR